MPKRGNFTVPAAWKGPDRRFAESIKENLEVLTGNRGDPLARAITARDLVDLGFIAPRSDVSLNSSTSTAGGFVPTPIDGGLPQLDVPPAPTSLQAHGAFQNIILSWDLLPYQGHAFTEIYRHTADDIANATFLGQISGFSGVYSDPVGESSSYYYWVRAVNRNGARGPFNDSAGTLGETATDLETLIAELKEDFPAVELATGMEGISVVDILPSPVSYSGANVVFLTTDRKLYRYNPAVPEWTASVPTSDLDGLIGEAYIAENAIRELHINSGAITEAKIALDSITESKIRADAVKEIHLAQQAVTEAKIATSAITTSKLRTEGRSIALNSDPYFQDPTAWQVFTDYPAYPGSDTGIFASITDGAAGNTVLRSAEGERVWYNGAERIPVNQEKAYVVRGLARRTANANDSLLSMGVALFDASGANIPGDPSGYQWFSGAAPSGTEATIEFTAYSAEFGAGTEKPFPAEARTMSPQVFMNYTFTGIAVGYMECQDLRIEEKIGADLIVDGTISTGKLLVTGRGAALNSDPFFQDPTAWQVFTDPAITPFSATGIFTSIGDGVAGNTALRTADGEWIWYNGSEKIPLDPEKTYRIRGLARRSADADGTLTIGVALFNHSGSNISEISPGDNVQWFSGAADEVTPDTEFTLYSADFGAGTEKPFPAEARTMSPLVILNFNGTSGYMECQDLRIEEKIGADLIVDGAITADKLAAGVIQAQEIAANSISTDKLVVIGAGMALNADPYFQDPTAWEIDDGVTFVSIDDGIAGNTAVRISIVDSYTARTFGAERIPVARNKTYQISAQLRRGDAYTYNAYVYLGILVYDINGDIISDPGGTYYFWYELVLDMSTAWIWTDFTLVAADFGVNTHSPLNDDARTVVPYVAVRSYSVDGSVGYIEVQDLRIEEKVSADLIVDGSILARHLATDSVTANAIEAGSITAQKMAASSISTDKLVVTGGGMALNADPYFQDPTAWEIQDEVTFVSIGDGVAGDAAIRVVGSSAGSSITGAERIPLDRTKTYRVSAQLRRSADADTGTTHLGIRVYDTNGDTVQKDAGDTYWYFFTAPLFESSHFAGGYSVSSLSTDFTFYSADFGAGTDHLFTEDARTMSPFLNLSYASDVGYIEVQDLRIEEKIGADLIVDGSIVARNLATGAVTTDKLLVTGRGAALNSDPYFQDPTAWGIFDPGVTTFVSITDGVAGNTALRGDGSGYYNDVKGTESIPIDRNKTYRVRALMRQHPGDDGYGDVSTYADVHLGILIRDANGDLVSRRYDANGYYISDNTIVDWSEIAAKCHAPDLSEDFTLYAADFGFGTDNPFTDDARTMVPYLMANYLEVQDLRIEEKVAADLFVDGSILARHLATDSVTANAIEAGSIEAGALAVGAINAENIITENVITGDHIQANSIVGEHIGGGVITGDHIFAGEITSFHVGTNSIGANSLKLDNTTLIADPVTGALRVDAIQTSMLNIDNVTLVENEQGQLQVGSLDAGSITVDNLTADSISGDINTFVPFSLPAPVSISSGETTIWVGQFPALEAGAKPKKPYISAVGFGNWENDIVYAIKLEMRVNFASGGQVIGAIAEVFADSHVVFGGGGWSYSWSEYYMYFEGDKTGLLPPNATLEWAETGNVIGTVVSATYNNSTNRTEVLYEQSATPSAGDQVVVGGANIFQPVARVMQRSNWDYHTEPLAISGGLGTAVTDSVDVRISVATYDSVYNAMPSTMHFNEYNQDDKVFELTGLMMSFR